MLALSRRPDSTRSPLYPLPLWGKAGVRGAFFVGFAGLINVGMVLIAQGLARQSHDSTKKPHVSGCAGVFYGSDTFSHVYESFVLTQTQGKVKNSLLGCRHGLAVTTSRLRMHPTRSLDTPARAGPRYRWRLPSTSSNGPPSPDSQNRSLLLRRHPN